MAKVVSTQSQGPAVRLDEAGLAVPLKPGEGATALLPRWGERSQYFMLAHGPESWELSKTEEGWRLLPVLKRLVVRPGVNWTKAAEGGTVDPSDLEAKARSRLSMVVLADEDAYLSRYPGHSGSIGHFLKWERVRVYDDGKWEVVWDQEGYDVWRWSLVTSGTVQPPRASALAEIRNRAQRSKQRAARTPHLEVAKVALAEATARLEGLVEAQKALEAISSAGKGRRGPVRAPTEEV